MPTIIIDGKEVQCRAGDSVLQAALDAGWNVPHYCYHPGLKIVASCRLCLMEMKMPHPRTKEMGWAPKLFPSCQTLVKDGLEVRFDSEVVHSARRHAMEYYLINHPLDCPVCDQAGECYLQDYSEQFGDATSRMVEDKHKNPKKDIGPHTLLYSDRCVMCKRCTRFCDEIAGTGELRVTNRGSQSEIDIFPGIPLDNEIQGNVVDLCPVGSLMDKDFLFKQRVWLLNSAKSISSADSSGAAIWIDHNNRGVHRVRARFNPEANEWWISDEARFGWKYINSDQRLNAPRVRRGAEWSPIAWEELAGVVRYRIENAIGGNGAGAAAVLSPMMSCEEAWLLAKFIREVAPQSTLVKGFVPIEGEDKTFPKGFVIRAEKCPNRRGVETIIEHFGGATMDFDEFVAAAGEDKFNVAYVVGGYPKEWITKDHNKALSKIGLLMTHDLFPSLLDKPATIRVPSASFAEREGSFMNCDGLVQPFERAITPLDGVRLDGQFFYELAQSCKGGIGVSPVSGGLFRASKVREQMAADIPALAKLHVPREEPVHAH